MSDELWFRFHPSKFMAGIRGLNANEVKAYICILCRLYENNGPIRDDVEILSTYCEMRPSSFEAALSRLVRLEKLQRVDGNMISNGAVEREISRRASYSENAKRAGQISRQKSLINQGGEAAGAQRPYDHIREDKDKDKNTPLPPKGGRGDDGDHPRFAEFKAAYPKRPNNPWRPASKAFWRLAKAGVDLDQVIVGTRGYAKSREGQDQQYTKQAVTFLNQECWTEYAARAPEKPAPSGPMVQMKDAEHPVALVIDLVVERGFNGLWGALGERWGPPPGEEGCIIPEWIISKAKDELKKSA